ncbi:kininogen-1-like [Candoia aspera]|uniref:kininogen-1-like n=1 Tax=Candoia aspera TaxID=51853 RepID=UPI002FD7E026
MLRLFLLFPHSPAFRRSFFPLDMEFFILIVLSIGFCQASSLQQEVDCDDPEVVDAVARAIKVLNEDQRHRNKFALNDILHAYRTAGPGKKIHVIYEARETTCPIAADEPWQNCDLLGILEGQSANCTADIDIHESEKLPSISQKCKINPGPENVRSHAQCRGCWHPIDTNSSEVHSIVRHTIQQFNNQSNHSSLFQLRIIIKAQRQVVNGWNYHLEYSIKETNCSKNTFQDLNPACRPLPGGQGGSCTAYAYVDSTNTLVSAEQACRLQVEERVSSSEVCAGCPIKIPRDSPELKKLLETALELFNEKSNRDFYFKVVKVTKATSQVVAGIMYRSDFKIQETNCSKAEVEKPDEHCTVVEDGELLFCQALVHMKLGEPSIQPQVNCTDRPAIQLAFRPPGFNPFTRRR